jgi:ABC-type sugar transport system ATPase subunit
VSDSVIRIRGLRKMYGPHVALDGVDLDIGAG